MIPLVLYDAEEPRIRYGWMRHAQYLRKLTAHTRYLNGNQRVVREATDILDDELETYDGKLCRRKRRAWWHLNAMIKRMVEYRLEDFRDDIDFETLGKLMYLQQRLTKLLAVDAQPSDKEDYAAWWWYRW